MNMRESTDPSRLAHTITHPPDLRVPATVWGKQNERRAVRRYEMERGVKVSRAGLVVDVRRPWLGCSPDGVLDDRLVEVKGLYAKRSDSVSAGLVDWLVVLDGHLKVKERSKYWWQVQGQMAIVGRDACDMVVFTDVDQKVTTVHRVPGLYEEHMAPKLEEFYREHMTLAMLT